MNTELDWKVVLGGLGLVGLALYQVSTGDVPGAVQSVFAALAAFGVKTAFDRNSNLLRLQQQHFAALKAAAPKGEDCCDDKKCCK